MGDNAPALNAAIRGYLADHHVRCPGYCGRDLYRVTDPCCPTCGRDLGVIVDPTSDPGASTLTELFDRVDLPCPHCAYSLRGLRNDTCPECGMKLEFEHFFGPPAEPIPRPPPALGTARSAAWGCVPALIVHVAAAVIVLAISARRPAQEIGLVAGALAILDAATILALFAFQRNYASLSLGRRQGFATLCWIWSAAWWILVCAGVGGR